MEDPRWKTKGGRARLEERWKRGGRGEVEEESRKSGGGWGEVERQEARGGRAEVEDPSRKRWSGRRKAEGENAEEQDKSCVVDMMSSYTERSDMRWGRRLETLSTIASHSNFFFRSSILADRVQPMHPRPQRGCPC